MLIVQTSNAYKGRFIQRATELVSKGVRVGRMYTSGRDCRCHICEGIFNPPVKEEGHNDLWGECPNCKAPFVFEFVT